MYQCSICSIERTFISVRSGYVKFMPKILNKFDDSGSFVTVQNTIFMISSDLGSRNKDANYRGPSIPLNL